MKISVITVVFNRHRAIGDAVASLQSQTYANFEHIVQDGASTDGTIEAVRAAGDHRLSLQSAPDKGIYDALNKAIERATGDVVGILHSDDVFASNSVLEKVAASLSNPEFDGVYGDLQYISKGDSGRVVRQWVAGEFRRENLARGWMPPHPTLFLRRGVFESLGSYDTRYRIAGDYDAMLRWLQGGEVRLDYIPEVLVRMKVGGESNRSFERIVRKSWEDLGAIRRNRVGGVGTLIQKNARKITQFLPWFSRSL